MPVQHTHQIHGARIHADVHVGGEHIIGAIDSQTINAGIEVIKETATGDVYPEEAYVNSRAMSASLATRAIKKILDLTGIRGFCIESTSNPGVQLYARKHECVGAINANEHREYTFRKGLFLPQSVSVSHQSNAVMSNLIVGIFDGTNDPLVIADDQSVPTTGRDTDRWTLGPATINGTTFDGKRSVNLDFGVAAAVESADSDIDNTWAAITDVAPMITIAGVEVVDWFNSIATSKPTHGNTTIYLRKRDTPDATPEHIAITANGLMRPGTLFDGTGNQPATAGVVIDTTWDGTLAPIVIDTAATIP